MTQKIFKNVHLILISLTLFIFFVYFSYLVHQGIFKNLDFDTTVRLQNHLSRRLDLPFSLLSLLGSFEITMLVWFALLAFIFLKKHYLTFIALFSFLAGSFVEIFGKLFLFHPAPSFFFYRGIGFLFPSSYVHTDYSYPSGHAFRVTFLVAFLILLISARAKNFLISLLLILLLALMYISRIYLGEHWLSDVIGGSLIGASLGIFAAVPLF